MTKDELTSEIIRLGLKVFPDEEGAAERFRLSASGCRTRVMGALTQRLKTIQLGPDQERHDDLVGRAAVAALRVMAGETSPLEKALRERVARLRREADESGPRSTVGQDLNRDADALEAMLEEAGNV